MKKVVQISCLVWLILMLVHDVAVKSSEDFSINLNILFFTATFGILAIIVLYLAYSTKVTDERYFYIMLSIYPIVRIILNLIGIGADWASYSAIVCNPVLDNLTWIIIIIAIGLITTKAMRWLKF